MRKLIYLLPFILFAWLTSYLTSCKKDVLFSKDYLSFSADTVLFDTVFTTIGSTTKRLKIYNTSNQPVKVKSVILVGGENSPFRINLDGVSGTIFKDFVIPADDSLFMFVEVTLGENNDTVPMIIEDIVEFETNGKMQSVQLAAWGQDAYFHYKDLNEGIWDNLKPHVIYDFALVDEGKSLTIEAGTRIYMHKGAILYVNKGELHIEGEYENKVIIEGDRLEPFYKDVKGQYYGIYFNEALSSTIDNAIIKNGTAGVHVFGNNSSNSGYTVEITNTEISNHASYGIFNYSGGKVKGENLNIHSNGLYAYFLLEGGSHNFRHSQFLSYGSDGNQPAVAIKNYFTREDKITYIGNVGEGAFYNSIIYGGGDFQIAYDTITNNGAVSIDIEYNTNFIRQKTVPTNAGFVSNTWNVNPNFENVAGKEFIIRSNSSCRNNGSSAFATQKDIIGTFRDMAAPDIGAYELD
ncbi:right-handed parallel beta-helix repeat-containing protein [Brumimicrobium glaciale]|uniref:Right-handed parallel beta-helix repeat-containing protein n=1 Tax=Brumimicrobium glaciale TaxID=200475 RepID=A0A4Q4KNA7_9FLAO|nr:right-handed parallel beta-helix repeat-containing protein [Brumimicrobium glaciale]RYM34875.1 right-handed parallel beta-helix repeat-containing protein [Brumimicrobium glaciale]